MEDVRSASYMSEWPSSGTARLRDGEFREPVAPGSAAEMVITVQQAAFGDLNGDGFADAAVVLAADPGGSGTFYALHVVTGASGEPQDAGSAFLGDRIVLRGVTIESGSVSADLLDRREDDPMSAPPMIPRQRRFELKESGLIESESDESQTAVGLEGFEWTLLAIRDPATGNSLDFADDRPPTVAFTTDPADEGADGAARRLAGFGGCNRFMGSYTASGDRLVISPLGTTMMMCAPAVMRIEEAFLPALQEASRYAISDNELTLRAGDRELVFERGSPVERL
jgi:hypothetical protein